MWEFEIEYVDCVFVIFFFGEFVVILQSIGGNLYV